MTAPAIRALIVAGSLVVMLGCGDRDTNTECEAAVEQGQAELRSGDLEAAKRSVETGRKLCGAKQDYAVVRLERDLATKERAVAARKSLEAEEARKLQENPLRRFVEWAGHRREAADKADVAATCYPRSSPLFGYCDSIKPDGKWKFETRTRRLSPDAFRFQVTIDVPTKCADLGEHRTVREWHRSTEVDGGPAHDFTFVHCEVEGGVLKGLSALIRTDDADSTVMVFSKQFLQEDAALRRTLDR